MKKLKTITKITTYLLVESFLNAILKDASVKKKPKGNVEFIGERDNVKKCRAIIFLNKQHILPTDYSKLIGVGRLYHEFGFHGGHYLRKETAPVSHGKIPIAFQRIKLIFNFSLYC